MITVTQSNCQVCSNFDHYVQNTGDFCTPSLNLTCSFWYGKLTLLANSHTFHFCNLLNILPMVSLLVQLKYNPHFHFRLHFLIASILMLLVFLITISLFSSPLSSYFFILQQSHTIRARQETLCSILSYLIFKNCQF